MIENLFTFVRTLGNQRIQGKKFFVTQVGLLGTVSDNSGSVGTSGKVLSSTGSGVSWIAVGSGNSNVAVLNDLTDVVIRTAEEGNLLRYNGTSWVNWAPNFLTDYGSLNDLSDVTLTTPVNGARLVYSSTTSQWVDANPLAFGKMYYGAALGDAATTTVITNGTRLGVGSLAMPTNLTVGQVDIITGVLGDGSIHIGGVSDSEVYLLASKNKIQVGSQVTTFIPGEGEGDEGSSTTTFTPSTLNIQPLGGDAVFGGYTTATGYKTPAGNRQELLTAAGTKTLTNSARNGQILRWIQPVGGVGNWQADDENEFGVPTLQEVTDEGSTTTNSITAANLNTAGTVTAAVVTTPLIEREGVLRINSEEQVDQGDPNPNLLYVSWNGDNKFVVNADGYAIATTGYKVVGGTVSGFLKANGTIDTNTYLTSYTETQTLDAVTDLGSTTTNNISVGGLTSTSVSTPILQSNSGVLIIDADINGGIEPEPGGPAEPILSFDWQGNTQGYIDTNARITFQGFKTPTGTASGFLKANGTVDTSAYITGIYYLDDIGDVVISSPAAGEVLMFDGAEWVNDSISSIDYISKVQHEVKAGVAIAKGQAVYVTSADGNNMVVGLASNTTEATSSKTMGLALSSAAINGKFFVVTEGLLDGLNTSTATIGNAVWLGVNGALIFGLTNKPVAPAHLVYLGVVTRVHHNQGEIFVHVQNGFELNEIHDVLINGVTAGQLIRREADGLWKNWTPDFITASSVDVLTNKRINLSTTIASIVPVDSIDPFLGQTDIVLYQDGIDRGGRIDVDFEGLISISNPGIGYYYGPANTEGGTRFLITVSGNTLTGTLAEFNEALTDGNLVTEAYVQSQIANLVDSAPATLNTLNELAAALGDDSSFATTVATSIGTKQNQLNGTGFVKASGTTISYDNSTYLTSESDPVFTASPAYGIAESNITKWNTAYGWGDHSTVGYLTSLPDHSHSISDVTGLQDELDLKSPIASPTFTGTPAAPTAATSTNTTQIATTAFVKAQGYITSETDPLFTESAAYNITAENILSWDDAYGWGNHADYSYITAFSETDTLDTVTTRGATTTNSISVNGLSVLNGGDLILKAATDSDDSGDIVFRDGSDNELHRLWSGVGSLNYRTAAGAAYQLIHTGNVGSQTVSAVATGTISNLNAAWIAPGASIANGFVVYRYGSSSTNQPVVADNANWLINIYSHPSEGGASYGHQLAAANGNNIYFRSVSNGTFSGWHKFWSTNDFGNATIDNWNAAYNNSITAASFATATGILTLTQQDLGTVTVNLDGRYLTSASDSQTLSYDSGANELTISNGNSINLDGLATEDFVTSQGYITGYTEADTLASVTGRGASTTSEVSFNAVASTNGTGDWTNATAYTFKINPLSSYWRIAHLSAHSSVSGVYTYQTGKSVYWGEDADTGDYVFRGRTLKSGSNTIWHAGNDGDGSGLDADSVDGVHASNIVWGNAKGTNDSVTTDADGLDKTGFYTSSGFVTRPEGVDNWMYIQHIKLYNDNSQYQKQIGYDTYDDSMWVRTKSGNIWSTWKPILTSENIGSYALTSIPAHNHDDRYYTESESDSRFYLATNPSGYIAVGSTVPEVAAQSSATRFKSIGDISQGAGNHALQVFSDVNNDAFMAFHISNDYAIHFGLDNTSNRLFVGGWSDGTGNKYQMWDSRDFSSTNITNWNTAYGWGDHAAARYASEDFVTSQGYITGYTETDTLASVTGRGASTTIPIIVTASEGREVAVYMASSYTTNDLVSGHEYGWYADHWRLGMTRSVGVAGADFVIQWNGARRLSLTNEGNVTISGTFTEQSSIRYKENVKSIPSVSQKVEQLDAVSYNKIGGNQEEIGLIAEDVAELFPEVVKYDDEGRPDGVNYSRLSVILLKAVQELTERVNKLENK